MRNNGRRTEVLESPKTPQNPRVGGRKKGAKDATRILQVQTEAQPQIPGARAGLRKLSELLEGQVFAAQLRHIAKVVLGNPRVFRRIKSLPSDQVHSMIAVLALGHSMTEDSFPLILFGCVEEVACRR
jgi:hypothetical protein